MCLKIPPSFGLNKNTLGQLYFFSSTQQNKVLNNHEGLKPLEISTEQQKHKHVFVHTIRKIIYSNCVKLVIHRKRQGVEGREEGGPVVEVPAKPQSKIY